MFRHAFAATLLSVMCCSQFIPVTFAADSIDVTSSNLHDEAKTVNPWFVDQKVIEALKKNLSESNDTIRLYPRDAGNYIDRARIYLYLARPEEAFKDANYSLSLKPTDKYDLQLAYTYRGEALLQLRKFKLAFDDLNKACGFGANIGESFYFRGMAEEKLGQLPQALKDYAMAKSLEFKIKDNDIDYSSYMEGVQKRIKSCWHPPKLSSKATGVVIFKILHDGKMVYLRLVKTFGSPAADNAALEAVRHAAPFTPLPAGAPRDVDVEFSFDYNAAGVTSLFKNVGEKWNAVEADALKKYELAKSSKSDTSLLEAELRLANIYRERGKYSDSIQLFLHALNLLEKMPEKNLEYGKALGHLAMVYALQGKTSDAVVEFGKAVAILDREFQAPSDPQTIEIMKEYAKVLYKANRVSDANKIYDRLMKR